MHYTPTAPVKAGTPQQRQDCGQPHPQRHPATPQQRGRRPLELELHHSAADAADTTEAAIAVGVCGRGWTRHASAGFEHAQPGIVLQHPAPVVVKASRRVG